jgi:deoxyribose-phosphate aldolase
MATPVIAHNKNLGKSFFSIRIRVGLNKNISQNNTAVTKARTRFKAAGAISSGEMIFTMLKLMPNNRFAVSTAR